MGTTEQPPNVDRPAPATPARRRWRVTATLVLLAPIVAEVLSGSTPVTGLIGLLFFVPMYGAGALLIRELARRRQLHWAGILLLGAAFGLIEEGLIVQAIFHPQAIEAASWGATAGGHVGGLYLAFAVAVVAYHAVWSIALPILLVDLLFPEHRTTPLFGRAGLLATALCYAAGLALVAVLVHTRIAPGYRTAPGGLAVAGLVVVALVACAYGRRLHSRGTGTGRRQPTTAAAPWIVCALTALTGFTALALLMFLPTLDGVAWHWATPGVRVGAEALIATIGLSLSRRWSMAPNWSERHRFAVAAGLLLVSPIVALVQDNLHSYGSRSDRTGLVAVEAIVIVFLARLAHQVHRRSADQHS
jgi:hypothetical protein